MGAVGVRLLRRARRRPKRVVRAIADTEYADAPVDEPGNDDLGAISSWYVWAAIGLFPVTPGSADLALASPLFPTVSILLPDGRRLVLHAPGAAASRPYIHALQRLGHHAPTGDHRMRRHVPAPPSSCDTGGTMPWLPASVLQSGGTLTSPSRRRPTPLGRRAAEQPTLLRCRAVPGGRFDATERGHQPSRSAHLRRSSSGSRRL